MLKIYEIPADKLANIKNILEAPEKITGELDVEIKEEAGKKGGKSEKAKQWKINEFKRVGYILRDARALEINKNVSYLYISAGEDFFKRNEESLINSGSIVLEGDEFDKVKNKIEVLEDEASSGIGFIFGQ